VSKPNALSAMQVSFCTELTKHLKNRGLQPRTLGETDFPNCTPIQAVKEVLSVCQGALILGFRQLHIMKGYEKPDTIKQRKVENEYLPTQWNQIEAGMAYMQDVPLMIIREQGVRGGVFDVGITDRYVHQAELSTEWLNSERFLQPFNEWFSDVLSKPAARTIQALGFTKEPDQPASKK